MVRYSSVCSLIMALGLLLQSCIYDDLSGCINDSFTLYIRIIDAEDNRDITSTGIIEKVTLYIFDHNKHFIKALQVSSSHISQRQPVSIPGYDPEGMFFSAWGNVGEQMNIETTGEGNSPENMKLTVSQDPGQPTYIISPNDFFFGSKELQALKRPGNHTEEIVLTQKNAKLHITVRGLENKNPEDYYFTIFNPYNGYDFHGTPTQHASRVKETGTFDSNLDFTSPLPYLMIHSENTEQAIETQSIRVNLHNTNDNNEIVSANQDADGNYITLCSGKTTNVLIDLTESQKLAVYIRVTPWDEIYQWSEF